MWVMAALTASALACGYPHGPCPDGDERYVPEVDAEFGYPDPRIYDSGEPEPSEWICPSGASFDGNRHYMLACGPDYCDDAYARDPAASWYCVSQDHLDAWMDEHCKGCWLNDGQQDPQWAKVLVCGEQEK